MCSLIHELKLLQKQRILLEIIDPWIVLARGASKKSGGSTQNAGKARQKHRGIKYQDGQFVQTGTILVTQNFLRFHPGLNVGLGRNGTLFAMTPGTVRVTSERPDLDMSHAWVKMFYGGRDLENLYKKYFNVVPEKDHNRFKLIDKV